MAFPSTLGSKQESLAAAWSAARNTATTIKSRSQSLHDQCAAGDVSATTILDYATMLADMKYRLEQVTNVGGIAAYAQAQINDPTIDIAAEYLSMATQIDTTISWIITNFPKDGSGYLLAVQFSGDNSGRTVPRQLSSAQTAGLRTILQALIATID